AADPGTCVRFDRHAFYVGQPGSGQSCPSGLIGSTGAVLVAPAPAGAQPSSATEDPVAHRIVVSAPRITVTAAYRNDRPQVLAIGIYIGGSDRACAQQNLTAAWVSQEAAAGWHFIPLYVGPQVAFKGEVTAATSQATGAAQDAAVQARTLGFRPGTPIYYDMEAYSPGRSRAALRFFTAWTTQLHSLGYKSAIYSSSDSGISDLASSYANTSRATPDVIYD